MAKGKSKMPRNTFINTVWSKAEELAIREYCELQQRQHPEIEWTRQHAIRHAMHMELRRLGVPVVVRNGA